MMEWVSGKVATTFVVLLIAASFLGLFGMQIEYYRGLKLEDVANAITDLVTEVDLLDCEVMLEINWTREPEVHGLPRLVDGEAYSVQFTEDRPYVVMDGGRAAGRYFPSSIELLDLDGERVGLLEVSSLAGFILTSRPIWTEHGLDHRVSVEALC